MARKATSSRSERKPKDNGKKIKKKVCIFCKNSVDFVDYKDVNLLRRFMSDRSKIKARRTTGNCVQHQSDVAMAIKLSRELALLPYATKVTSSRGGGRGGGRGRDRDDRGPRDRDDARGPEGEGRTGPPPPPPRGPASGGEDAAPAPAPATAGAASSDGEA
jgi:small subunit ribosomal protein S18